ncbi:hypothetical protein MGA5115_00830 [Marinomonas gallaica]|uniref:Uncharacterized protein n=1 Tax=Marinomonas gallaica TaxID=1806667 RepID=A0A1C3JNI8_9GAMM|nr:hypothetical protein [Marinomonas gallaica]SBT16746.1 hypothetical protein MGA5115_00830 [Marinomonas gallaica]SBT20462.1 hypothetical protein MGA5116_01048 [Marinomonas gallaica]
MLFIDTVKRINQLPEREDHAHFRRRRNSPSKDSLTLSDAASHVQQITLTYEYATELTPTDSIIANMLEAVIQQVDQLHIHVEALSHFAPANDSWQLPLQTPPPSFTTNEPSYGDSVKDLKHEKQNKKIELHLLGADGTEKVCLLTFVTHHLSDTLRQALIKLSPKQTLHTPYSAEQLEPLPQQWLFEIDQDGEAEPLEDLYNSGSAPKADYDVSFAGLQIWFERQNDALPLLISDVTLGYIYIGNYEAYGHDANAPEESNMSSGTLDTSA